MLAQVKQHLGFRSDVVGPEGAVIFELSTGKREPLLLRTNSLLISELLLDVFNGIRSFNLERDGCSGEAVESTDVDPHARQPVKHKIEDRFCLDAMLPQRTATFKLLAIKDEALLVWRNGFLVMDLGLDSFDRVRWLDPEGNQSPCREDLDKDEHTCMVIYTENVRVALVSVQANKSTRPFSDLQIISAC